MIRLGPEPEGLLLKRADILAWLPGLSAAQWKKIRPSLTAHTLPGCERPHYFKSEIKTRLVEPMLKGKQ